MKIPCPRVYLLALSAIAVFTLASCSKPQRGVGGGAGGDVRRYYPGPNPAWQGKAAGGVQPFGPVGEDLKASLLGHPAPEVWLAFPPAAGQEDSRNTASGGDEPATIRVDLPPEAVASLSAYWRETLALRYELDINDGGHDGQAHGEMVAKLFNASTQTGNGLMKMQIVAPDGGRAICPAEAWGVMEFVNHSAAAVIEQAKGYKE